MARKPKLKVFTAPMGFHDVFVAAPSRAAALRAWGSDHDLFARGVALEVTDTALMKAPLAHPGEVVRLLRGTEAEQFAALPKEKTAARTAGKRTPAPAKPARPARPRPSREALVAAEAALEEAQARHREQDEAARRKVEAAERERRDLGRRNALEARALATKLDDARSRYERALSAWRSND